MLLGAQLDLKLDSGFWLLELACSWQARTHPNRVLGGETQTDDDEALWLMIGGLFSLARHIDPTCLHWYLLFALHICCCYELGFIRVCVLPPHLVSTSRENDMPGNHFRPFARTFLSPSPNLLHCRHMGGTRCPFVCLCLFVIFALLSWILFWSFVLPGVGGHFYEWPLSKICVKQVLKIMNVCISGKCVEGVC